MKILHIFIGLLLAVSCFFVSAFEINESECNTDYKKTKIYFGNGMFNSIRDREKSLNEVISLIRKDNSLLSDGEGIFFDFAINQNESSDIQLFQVLKQRTSISWDDFKKIFFKSNNSDDLTDEQRLIVKENLPNLMKSYSDVDLRAMIENYLKDLDNGYRVIIIAHSQGNMYANLAIQYIIDNYPDKYGNSIGMVSVATPDSKVLNGGIIGNSVHKNVTASQDRIIDFVRFGFPISTLSSSFRFKESKWNGINHSFVNYYMKDDNSIFTIYSSIKWAFENIQFPEENLCNEDIFVSAQLTSDINNVEFIIEEHIVGMDNKQGDKSIWSSFRIGEKEIVKLLFSKEDKPFSKYMDGKYIINSNNLELIRERQNGFVIDTLGVTIYAIVKDPQIDENGNEILPNLNIKIQTPLDENGGKGLEFDVLNYKGEDEFSIYHTSIAHISIQAKYDWDYNYNEDRYEHVLKEYIVSSSKNGGALNVENKANN